MKYKLLTLLICVACIVNVNAGAYEMLRHNPFEQPEVIDSGRGAPGQVGAATGLELRGTVIDDKDAMANIDGEYYRLNHEVSGYRVIRIERGSVTLSRGGNEKVLTLHDDEQTIP